MVTTNSTCSNSCLCSCRSRVSKLVASGSDENNFRLSDNVVPSHYEIALEPDLTNFTFTGSVSIDVKVLKSTHVISLNAKELSITEAYVQNESGTQMSGCVELDEQTQMAHIFFVGKVGAGLWQLKVNFTGVLNDSLKGFYRSFWTDANGNKHAVATTQFESTDARRCFPCFDEPHFKATYKAYLTVDENLTALSNGRIVNVVKHAETNKKTVEFATTMKMSTYLVAFIVGEFESSEPVFVNGKQLRIWANPGKKQLMPFALKSASHAINWYETYYGVPYPGGDKIDFIAINDFAAGAMENLGCITFRETSLLVDEATATQSELERVAEVVMHELAHMWFGDLVTMKWWNGLWLNESFATFMQLKALAAWRPSWRIWDKFAMSRAAASRTDALNSTHAIECKVLKPEDAQELFDVISYEKGCSTLYQIEQFMGEEVFRAGVSHYLKAHAFGNTETHDLWDSLELAGNDAKLTFSVRDIMDAWVFTPGHPVLKVSTCSKLSGFVEITQSPFKFLSPTNPDTLYPVPVTMKIVRSGQTQVTKFVLTGKSQTVYVGEDFDYLVVNAGGSGFYRVIYDNALAAKVASNVQANLGVVERFNLVNDTWAAVRSKMVTTSDYLGLVELFKEENDANVWSVISGSLSGLYSMVDKSQRKNFARFVRNLARPAFAKLGYETKADDSIHVRQLRSQLMAALGTIGNDKAVQAKAAQMFEAWKKDKGSIDPNVLPAVVSILACGGDKKRYYEFKHLFQTATTPQDANRFMYALASFTDSELLAQTLNACVNGEIRSQDAPFVIGRLLGIDDSKLVAWEFVKANWDKMVELYPANVFVRMVGAVASLDTTSDLVADVRSFFASHKVESGSMALAQAFEQQTINSEARAHHSVALTAHFTK